MAKNTAATLAHPYPSLHRPGTHWATDESWVILDTLPVGLLPDDQRFLLAGMIAGSLMRVRSNARTPLLRALSAASHALKSYAHGNAATELATAIAQECDLALAYREVGE